MAKRKDEDGATGPSTGHNVGELNKKLVEARDKIIALQAERDSISDDINAIRSDMRALGFPKKSFDKQVKRFQMDPDKRLELDTADQVISEAFGMPLNATQAEMFEEDQPRVPVGKDAAAGASAH